MDVGARRAGRELADGVDLRVRGGADELADGSGGQGLATHAGQQTLACLVDGLIALGKGLQFGEVGGDGLGTLTNGLNGA